MDWGFKVRRIYVPERKEYKFDISRGDITKTYWWRYTNKSDEQKKALDSMIVNFYRTLSQTSFLNHENPRLEGSIDKGYYYTTTIDIHLPKIKPCVSIDDGYANYIIQDVEAVHKLIKRRNNMIYGAPVDIKDVIFNEPATIVFWTDGTKTVVKAVNESFDKEKGLAMAISKKFFGNKGNYYNHIKKWLV